LIFNGFLVKKGSKKLPKNTKNAQKWFPGPLWDVSWFRPALWDRFWFDFEWILSCLGWNLLDFGEVWVSLGDHFGSFLLERAPTYARHTKKKDSCHESFFCRVP